MEKIELLVNAHSQQGTEREVNQDGLGIKSWRNSNKNKDSFVTELSPSDLPSLLLLADGIGGHEKGEVASRTAIDTIFQYFDSTSEDFNISSAVMEAHSALNLKAQQTYRSMGTTILGIVMEPSGASLFNVGDSRGYKLRDNAIIQISVDDIRNDMQKNIITQCLGGGARLPKPHHFNEEYQTGDIFILLSDGVTDHLSDNKIFDIVNSNHAESAFVLCNQAVKAGSGDDVSAIVIYCSN